MSRDIHRKTIIESLEREFPTTTITVEGEEFNSDKHGNNQDYAPLHSISWDEFMDKLNEVGLCITYKTQRKK